MTFNKSKCWIPHLGQGNPGYMYKLGDKRLESGPTERERFGLVASCIRINSVPWQPKGPTLFWCASSTAQLAGQGRWLSHSVLHWSGPTSNTVCSVGSLNVRRTPDYGSVPRGEWPRWWKVLRVRLMCLWLRSLGLFNLEKRRLRADPIAVYTFLKGGGGGGGADLLSLVKLWQDTGKWNEAASGEVQIEH